MGTILVHHLAGTYSVAGLAYQTLNHLLPLKRLGHDVWFIQDSGAWPFNPKKPRSKSPDCSYNINFVKNFMKQHGLDNKWAYWDGQNNKYYGLSKESLKILYNDADAILNVCGATHLREEHLKCPVRIYIESDPFHQIDIENGDLGLKENISMHTHHFTYASNLGDKTCPIPEDEFIWKKTVPPVFLDAWKCDLNPKTKKFTTVTTWQTPKKHVIKYGNKQYLWSKIDNFLRFSDIPQITKQRFELAILRLNIHARKHLRTFNDKRWDVVEAYKLSSSLNKYKKYISSSRGEFTVAKDLVVRTNSGWFSDRSVCYLASGKPVVTQETGFSKSITTGKGLFSFSTMNEAVDAINEINRDYEYHCKEARKVAEKYFDSEKVLGKMLKQSGVK